MTALLLLLACSTHVTVQSAAGAQVSLVKGRSAAVELGLRQLEEQAREVARG